LRYGCDIDGGNYCDFVEYYALNPAEFVVVNSSSCEICDDNERVNVYYIDEIDKLIDDIYKTISSAIADAREKLSKHGY